MKWARVENNRVVEVTIIDPKGRFVLELQQQFIQCPDEVEQGWQYIEPEWIAPIIEEIGS